MNKKHTGYLYYAIAVLWSFSAVINSIVSLNYSKLSMSMAFVYGGLAAVSIGLAVTYIVIGNRKRK